MRAGMMDRRIVIDQDTATTPNTHGEIVPSWSTLATVWAYRKPLKGSEKQQSQQELAQAEYMFRIRHRTDVTPEMRINYDGAYYDIIAVFEISRKHGTEIFAKRNVA